MIRGSVVQSLYIVPATPTRMVCKVTLLDLCGFLELQVWSPGSSVGMPGSCGLKSEKEAGIRAEFKPDKTNVPVLRRDSQELGANWDQCERLALPLLRLLLLAAPLAEVMVEAEGLVEVALPLLRLCLLAAPLVEVMMEAEGLVVQVALQKAWGQLGLICYFSVTVQASTLE
eukprot:scaffold43048_cov18-Tisochrysis_lutea.AAC.1